MQVTQLETDDKAEEVPEYSCPWFKALVERKPALIPFAAALKTLGYNTKDTFEYLEIEEMARLKMPPGIRFLIEQEKKQLKVAVATSSNQPS